jgi:putative ABC transport system permease protein
VAWSRFLRRGSWDEERRREIDAYLALETDDNIARGMAPDEARHAAHRKLGNPALIREEIYQMNTVAWLDNAWRDLRYGARLLRLNPGFAAVAILSLALGVGANTAIFQLLDAVRIRTLPVAHPEQLAEVRIANATNGRTGDFVSRRPMLTNPLWEQLRDHQQAFSNMLVWGSREFELASGGESRPAQGMWVNGDFFETLGVPSLVGRLFTASDDRRGCSAPGAVISYGFWQRTFGGNAAAIGKSLILDAHSYDIVGVTPASFFGVEVGRTFDVAVPLCAEPLVRGADSALDKRDVWFLAAFGRLKPGWTIEQANAQVAAISGPIFSATLPTYRPEEARSYVDFKFGAFPAGTGVSNLRRTYESPLWLLLATTGLVLLIACANLANLMLARATARERELAVRLALGASRGRIVRQLLAESFLIAAIGAASGALLAQWLSQFLLGFLTADSGAVTFVDLTLDWRVFAFTAILAALTCLVFGLLPALRATAAAPGAAMKAGSRGMTDSRERFGVRRALVVTQVALSLVLMVGALLFVRSLRNLLTLDPGFEQDGILVASLDLRGAGIPEARRAQAYQDVVERFRRLPGVTSAAQAFIVPVSGNGWNNNILIDGKKHKENVNFDSVSDGYFKTMGTPILAGRDFDRSDTASSSRKVAIVTQSFAKLFFGGANPIGRTFQIDVPPGESQPVYEIVGFAKDTKYTDLREAFEPLAFLAATQDEKPRPFMQTVVRSSAPLPSVIAEVVAAVREVDTSATVQFKTVSSQVRSSLLRERLMATLSGFFGGLAALIATIGLYGVMSYTVVRRKHEIGIRMALGADRQQVVRMIVREAAMLLAAGLVAGVVMSIAAAKFAEALLFGLRPQDPVTLMSAVAMLATVALAASYLPALRAARLEPTIALHDE